MFDKLRKICVAITLIWVWGLQTVCLNVRAEEPTQESAEKVQISAPAAVLMEATTGQVIYEKNSSEIRSPASITKIMTMLLAMEALEKNEINLKDEVVTSEYAASMGGSQVYLEMGEVQTVETLLKCIAVASGNDASVALAEHIAGTEEAFSPNR